MNSIKIESKGPRIYSNRYMYDQKSETGPEPNNIFKQTNFTQMHTLVLIVDNEMITTVLIKIGNNRSEYQLSLYCNQFFLFYNGNDADT